MDLNSIGTKISSSVGTPMSVESPQGFPMFAYEHPKKGWQVTDDPDGIESKLKVKCEPCEFIMVSKDSREFRKRAAALFKQSRSNKKRTFADTEEEYEDAETEAAKTIAAGIVGWNNIVWNDNPSDPKSPTYLIEFNEANLIKVLFGYRIVLDQANEFIANRANFSKGV